MNVGELFVNLGVKGSDKTIGAITNVKKGLGETASVSLEAKAGILAAMYALERLVATSGAVGTGLTNFNALTGLSTKQLQQWQYAARQAGVSGEELTGSLKAVQNSMTNMLLGKGAPEGLGMLANKVGFDPKKARDTFYVMEQLQKFAKTVPNDVGNSVIKSFGVSEGTIAAMRRNAFNPGVMKNAPTYSDGEIKSLDRANIAWSNLGNKIEMAVGRFNAKHGAQLVKDFDIITSSVLKLAEALEKVDTKLKLFETIAHGFEGIANTFKLIGEISDKFEGKQSKKGDLLYVAPGQEALPGFSTSPVGKFLMDLLGSGDASKKPPEGLAPGTPVPAIPGDMRKSITPKLPAKTVAPGSTNNVNINQNLNFQHDGKDHKQTSDSVKKANQDAFRQFSQGQVN